MVWNGENIIFLVVYKTVVDSNIIINNGNLLKYF